MKARHRFLEVTPGDVTLCSPLCDELITANWFNEAQLIGPTRRERFEHGSV